VRDRNEIEPDGDEELVTAKIASPMFRPHSRGTTREIPTVELVTEENITDLAVQR
jgi:hypothetical protein